jgi:hypothetical protein
MANNNAACFIASLPAHANPGAELLAILDVDDGIVTRNQATLREEGEEPLLVEANSNGGQARCGSAEER